MKQLILGLIFICFSSIVNGQNPIERIAFGSCGHQIGEQFIWNSVIATNPELWIWLGDNIYGDTEDMDVLRRKYQQLGDNYNYQLLKAKCPIIATWDDHDYGVNDGGKEYPRKAESQKVFLDFFEEPSNSPRWKQEGIYTSYDYGTADKQVKVILLDQRYHRDEPDTDGDVLGEAQWKWLEDQFRSSTAKIVLVGASFQFISDQHPFETWGHFPSARERMLQLIKDTGVKGVIFISGDRHFAELSKLKRDDLPYPIYDYMCSGLTHANNVMVEKNPHRMRGKTYYHRNFGMILFDWQNETITLQNRKVNQKVSFEHTIPFTELGW
ncbi:MAG: alkaline phosphatase family protein [Flavobacteriales bacterium]|nr:alkaline phosphatase family protein [Flavobacteriales bacterium]